MAFWGILAHERTWESSLKIQNLRLRPGNVLVQVTVSALGNLIERLKGTEALGIHYNFHC